MTQKIEVSKEWVKISDGENLVLQNIGSYDVEVRTGDDSTDGFILGKYNVFSYSFGEPVYVRARMYNSVIICDKYTNNV